MQVTIDYKKDQITTDEMREYLVQYYEAAGIANVDKTTLATHSDAEIKDLYFEISDSAS